MGQAVSRCSACWTDCWQPRRPDDGAIKPGKELSDVQQPLVVEDESWKKWSSYNLIHAAPDNKDDRYNPPAYVSQQQQSAEAVWDL
ncbi:hypothetical protein PINS_up004280 [Pythium insidiosum]|nr:hypothetical protein PINS_up004280 [Pythium insidiosum]